MNKWTKRMTAIGLAAALCVGGVSVALAQTGKTEEQSKNDQNPETVQTLPNAKEQASKDETVYVLAGSDGAVQKIIVSDWIENPAKSMEVTDYTELTNVENVKGDEGYAISGENMKVWDAQGNDLYYQGSVDKELPVQMTVTYRLDGKTVSAQELAGKSGRVSIRFDYENREYEMVEIGGKKEKIYVPFAMLTGMMLDSDTFRNVEVSNGKRIQDGDHIFVLGLTFPGLQENLGWNSEKWELPNYVEIAADVTDFEMGMTVTLATNAVFENMDEWEQEGSDDLKSSMTMLTDAMTQLMDGSSALYDGLCTLLEKSDSLVSGIEQLAEGAKAVADGAEALDNGAGQVQTGLVELSSGLDTLSANSTELREGAAQFFETLLATATAQVRAAGLSIEDLTIENYAEVLNRAIASLDAEKLYEQASEQVAAAVEARRSEIVEKVTETVRATVEKQVRAEVEEQVTVQVLAASGMSKETYEAAVAGEYLTPEQQAAIQTAIEAQMASESIQQTIATTVEMQMQTDAVQAVIAQNVQAQIQTAVSENMSSSAVQSQLSAAASGAKTLSSLKASLDGYNTFYQGLQTYTAGVDSAANGTTALFDGVSSLKEGAAQLRTGAQSLYQGALRMKDGMPALVDGITELRDGAMELSDGMQQFYEEGIQKLADRVDGDVDHLAERLNATMDVCRSYRSFAGISEDMQGQVKFIYRTEEVTAE